MRHPRLRLRRMQCSLLIVALVVLSMGCQPACPHAPAVGASREAPEGAPASALEPALRTTKFQLGLEVMGRETNAAWIHVEVNGVKAKAILDTGAEANVIQAWFAEEAKMSTDASEQADVTDSSEKSLKASIVSVHAKVEGWGDWGGPAILIPSIPMFEQARIGMIVNPLLLAKQGLFIRLDFPAHMMAEVEALSAPGDAELETCTSVSRLQSGTRIATHRAVTKVKVFGVWTRLHIDSGGRTTVLAAASDAAKKAAELPSSDETARGAIGTETVKVIASAVEIEAGGATMSVRGIRLSPSSSERSSCQDEGLLGMDVVQHCVVELSPTDTRLTCKKP